MKNIDEVNLMDDIFMNLVASDPDFGDDFCRTLLSVLLGQKIGKVRVHVQRVLPGSGLNLRGIRLDVEVDEMNTVNDSVENIYDIEPHNRREENIGRMLRFRQAKIDSRYMNSGENDFSHLPNLYMILITDTDYFGKDYMMYTIRNSCVEFPGLEYEDGLRIIYFNTKGNKGGSDGIRNMLKYLQDSRCSSAVDDATRKLDEYVSIMRRDPEKRGNYMTFGDRIDWEKQISHDEGLAEGLEKGRKEGVEQIVVNMLQRGMASEEIADLCGCDASMVLKIKENTTAGL